MIEKIFIDTDIILDLILEREPFSKFSTKLFSLIENKKIKAFTSPLIFSNLFYILRKLKSREDAIVILKKLKMLLNLLEVNDNIIELALVSEFKDFEDAIQYYVALNNGIKTLITRNLKDYKHSKISVYTAEDYLKIRKLLS